MLRRQMTEKACRHFLADLDASTVCCLIPKWVLTDGKWKPTYMQGLMGQLLFLGMFLTVSGEGLNEWTLSKPQDVIAHNVHGVWPMLGE